MVAQRQAPHGPRDQHRRHGDHGRGPGDRAGEAELKPADSELEEAEILATGRGMSWDEVVAGAEQAHDRVRAAFSTSPDPGETAVGWFRDDTFDHYDEHTAEIRAFVA